MNPKYDIINDSPHTNEMAQRALKDSTYTLSIDECKKYLGETNLTDKEIKELRDAICSFIDSVLDNYFDGLVQ